MQDKIIDIWINCPDRQTAVAIADALLASRLVACANIYPEILSHYHWKGRIERETEIPLVVKTLAENFSRVAEDVRKIHPYETPGIMGVPVDFVNREYHDWVVAELEQSNEEI